MPREIVKVEFPEEATQKKVIKVEFPQEFTQPSEGYQEANSVFPTQKQLQQEVSSKEHLASRFLGESLPAAGSVIGAYYGGGTPGALAGASIGEMLRQRMQVARPDLFGAPPQDVSEAGLRIAKEAGVNWLGNRVGNLIGAAVAGSKNIIKAKLAKMFVTKPVDPDIINYAVSHPDLEFSVGQMGGGLAAKGFENIPGHFEKQALVDRQQQWWARKWADMVGGSDPEATAQVIMQGIKKGRTKLTDIAEDLYSNAERLAEQKVLTIPAKTKQVSSGVLDPQGNPILKTVSIGHDSVIKGPINPTLSSGVARRYLDALETDYKKSSADALLGIFKEDPGATKLIQNLKRLTEGDQPIPYAVAKNIKESFGDKANFFKLFKNKSEGEYTLLNKLVKQDIVNSLPPDARAAYLKADKHYEEFMTLYHDNPAVAGLLNEKLSGISKVNAVLQDPVAIKSSIQAADNPALAKKSLQKEFLAGLHPQGLGETGASYNVRLPYEKWTARENQPMIRELFDPKQIKEYTNMFKTFAHLDPKLPMAGITSLGYHTFRNGIYITGTLATAALGGGFKASGGSSLGLVGLIVGSKEFADRVLMNPEIARIASNLAPLPPSGPVAKALSKSLFTGLKGLQVYLTTPDGKTVIGTGRINNQGKVEAEKALSDTSSQ